MTEIYARALLSSVSPDGIRIDTVMARYPLWIHAELMTHRAFSRNAASNRAIPFDRMVASVEDDPAVPLVWTAEQRGMSGAKIEDPNTRRQAIEIWAEAQRDAVHHARRLAALGIHKQMANRLMMAHQHMTVQITATDWANFEALRIHPAAEPHMQLLAKAIADARAAKEPQRLTYGEWHLPWVLPDERDTLQFADQRTLSVARSASISYATVDSQQMTLDRANALVEKLMQEPPDPVHASPFEHQATPDAWSEACGEWHNRHMHGNLFGWLQYRKMLPREVVVEPGRERFR